ncbi:hypothetical protein HNQ56_004381 [Anaerotaenia torta]|uniref:TraX family protein n=1 Tax=Anaerotaenia torta TaxID=433293 RepID=UPI003D249260
MDNSAMTMMEAPKKVRKGIPGSTLKLIAIIVMLIDHTAATILDRILQIRGTESLNGTDIQASMNFLIDNAGIYTANLIMRLIGRIAFPIFCFLLVEGFKYTRNKWNYAIRLGIFALVSEIPFDLALKGKLLEFSYQNVYFTLLIGLLAMIGFELVRERLADKKWLPLLAVGGAIAAGCMIAYGFYFIVQFVSVVLSTAQLGSYIRLETGAYITMGIVTSLLALLVYWIIGKKGTRQKAGILYADLLILIAGMALAQYLKTDYSAFGVLTIAVVYWLRRSNVKAVLGACITLTVMSIIEATAFLALIPAAMYNGTRGWRMKYVFYVFYPAHLLILYLICRIMKLV